MSDLLSKWLVHYDPIHRGWTPRGIANGVCATNGYCFPRIAGGYNLYRGPSGGSVVTDVPVGAAGAKATSIETFTWRPGRPAVEYGFELRSVGGGGVESAQGSRSVRVKFDGAGDAEPLRPNPPCDVAVTPTAGGRFVVTWRYVERSQETAPAAFNVFSDGGTGTIDFQSPIGVVAYSLRAGFFDYTTGVHVHGATRMFAVRAVSDLGADDGETRTAWGCADATGPATPVVFNELIEAD